MTSPCGRRQTSETGNTVAVSPMSLSLDRLISNGYTPFKTEHWNAFARIRQDLAGFIDILALRKGEVLAVQCTSWNNVSSRVKKIAEHENTPVVRDANIRIVVWGWKKVGRGQWECREVDCS